MPQCKKDYCKEPAVDGPWRKQYCREHGEAYLAKRKEYQKNRALLPDCAGNCGAKARVTRLYPDGPLVPFDHGLCLECEKLSEEQEADHRKQRAFESAETVEELKDWIRDHLL